MQLIPSFDWSDNAKKVREYVYKYWGEHSYPPSTLAINRASSMRASSHAFHCGDGLARCHTNLPPY